jgi:hypothetical protein
MTRYRIRFWLTWDSAFGRCLALAVLADLGIVPLVYLAVDYGTASTVPLDGRNAPPFEDGFATRSDFGEYCLCLVVGREHPLEQGWDFLHLLISRFI